MKEQEFLESVAKGHSLKLGIILTHISELTEEERRQLDKILEEARRVHALQGMQKKTF